MTNWREQHFQQHEALFYESQTVIQQGSSSFYFAFSKLPAYQAHSIFAVYNLLRLLDDSVDDRDDTLYEALTAEWAAFKRGATPTRAPWPALRIVWQLFTINPKWVDDMWTGQNCDRQFQQPQTQADLTRYCYQVAGTVGLILMPILTDNAVTTVNPAVIDLGIAMQLTNILRDIGADAKIGRCYLPVDACERYGLTAAVLQRPEHRVALRNLLIEQAQLAENAYGALPTVLALIPNAKSRQMLELASDVYHGILTKIIANDYDVLSKRIHLSLIDKLKLVKPL